MGPATYAIGWHLCLWESTYPRGRSTEECSSCPGLLNRLMTYRDANLMHDLLPGKAVTGLLHFRLESVPLF